MLFGVKPVGACAPASEKVNNGIASERKNQLRKNQGTHRPSEPNRIADEFVQRISANRGRVEQAEEHGTAGGVYGGIPDREL